MTIRQPNPPQARPCDTCNGTGTVPVHGSRGRNETTCPNCNGTGEK